MAEPLDIRDIAIIDAFPVYGCNMPLQGILDVGCGDGRIDFHLASMGYRVYATDIKKHSTWNEGGNPSFHISNIFDISSFPVASAPIVICSQTLERIQDYKKVIDNLLQLTEIRLIITIPFKRSFYMEEHLNFWDDKKTSRYRDVHEFTTLCASYMVSISKIITKPQDAKHGLRNYLIIVDKRQNYTGSP